MKNIRTNLSVVCLTLMVAMFAVTLSPAQEKPLPNVALVNGLPITQGDFDREMQDVRQRLVSMGKPVSDAQLKEIKMDVLEGLIDQELLYQESRKRGIKIEEQKVEEQINVFKKRLSSEDEFKKALLRMSLSEDDLKDQIRRNLVIRQFIDNQFSTKTSVSEEEAKDFYDKNPDAFKRPEQIRASHILIKVDAQADEAQKTAALKKMEEIQKKIAKGDDFSTLAKEHSQCPSAKSGGDLGYFGRGQMVGAFETAAFALAPNEVSGIVKTRFGYHIIKSTDKKSEGVLAYNDVKEKLQQYLKQKKVQEQIIAYTSELEKKGKVERLMKES